MLLNRKDYKLLFVNKFMPIKSYKNDLMFKLKSSFIKNVFDRLSLEFGNSKKASDFLCIPYSSFRGYKNGYFYSLPDNLISKILRIGIISQEELKRNKLSTYYRDEQNKQVLRKGRFARFNQLKQWRESIPPLKEILIKNNLNFEKWFLAYKKLINFGARKFNYIKSNDNFIEVSYHTHSNKIRKEFVLKFPKKIKLDEEFIYFFGLWVGDKAGGGRFGIMNKEPEIVSFTKKYLIKLHQIPEVVLYIAKNQDLPKNEKFNKIVKINGKAKGYAFSTHSINGILVSFFNYLESNLSEFLYSIKASNIFFAGLFDAEGNIFLEDSCFRWSCENPKLIPIFQEHLKRLNLFNRYDGSNFVSYNKNEFSNRILPFLIHPKKINNSNLVCFGKGHLEGRFREILDIIKENSGITNRELAKALKKVKSYAQVRLLEKLGYIYSKNYPKQLFINNKFNIGIKQ